MADNQSGRAAQENSSGSNGKSLIDLRNIVKTYRTEAGDFVALKSIDLKVGSGEFVAVIGKSGSGKSTLINMITGIDRPTSGEVYVADTSLHNLSEGRLARWRGRNLGIVFQFFQLLPTLTVLENVMLPMDFCRMYSPRERRDRAMQLLGLMDVAAQANKLPSALSGGQQQRVAIARALANDPRILLADEPTGNLDSRTADQVFQLFEDLVDEGKTVVVVTHDDDLAQRARRTVVIADGEIVNEYLARALPGLSQQLLVEATRQLVKKTYHPGESIIYQDALADNFYIVTRGEVHVYLRRSEDKEIYVDTLGPGQFFGEIALLGEGQRTASVRAAPTVEVEVATLGKEAFLNLMQESGVTRADVERVVYERTRRQAAQSAGGSQ